MSIEKRVEILTRRLQGRTSRTGEPLPGFKSNVASLRAELAQLQDQLGNDNGDA